MNIIVTGPQGSGKGTQAHLLAEKLGYYHLENGKMLRKMAETDERIRKIMDDGILVPDLEMLDLMEKNLVAIGSTFDNIIFDGYPRNVNQYKALKEWLESKGKKIDLAVVISISEDETVRRLSSRRVHKKTGEIYNLLTKPPVGIPEGELYQRDDDNPDSIKKRLEVYNTLTRPMIDLYREDNILFELDGERPIEDIQKDILEKIDNYAH